MNYRRWACFLMTQYICLARNEYFVQPWTSALPFQIVITLSRLPSLSGTSLGCLRTTRAVQARTTPAAFQAASSINLSKQRTLFSLAFQIRFPVPIIFWLTLYYRPLSQRQRVKVSKSEVFHTSSSSYIFTLFLANVFVASVPSFQMFDDEIAVLCDSELMDLIYDVDQIICATKLWDYPFPDSFDMLYRRIFVRFSLFGTGVEGDLYNCPRISMPHKQTVVVHRN